MKRLVSLALWFIVLVSPRTADACQCIFNTTTKEDAERADIVFRGKLVRHGWGTAVFQVEEQWKGDLTGRVALEWREGNHGDCNGFWPDSLKVGNDLLVFAVRDYAGSYRTSICFPTRLAADATKELQDLGPGKPPLAGTATIDSLLLIEIYTLIGLIVMFGAMAYRRARRRSSA